MYKLNDIDLSDFGIVAARAPQSTLAMQGFLDFPSRINKTEHSWGDQNGIDPYVSSEEMFYGGRDIDFFAYMKASNSNEAIQNMFQIYDMMDSLSDLVIFSTPRGEFSVYVREKISVLKLSETIYSITFPFREPVVDLSGGVIPDSDEDNVHGIDGIKFQDLGFTVLNLSKIGLRRMTLSGFLDRPQPKSQDSIGYSKEHYQVTKVDQRDYIMNGLITAESHNQFNQVIKNLYAVFKEPGTRVLYMPGDIIRMVFVKNGFKVRNIISNSDSVKGVIEFNFTEALESNADDNYLFLGDTLDRYVTTTVGQKILVKI